MDSPHRNQPLKRAGTPVESARVAVVLVHGRGATAEGILQLAESFPRDGVAYLAPQAAKNTWYPNPFTAAVESNEPGRTSGLEVLGNVISVATEAGVPTDRVILFGFSQGACLASEFVARNPRGYGGLVALSGGLIGETIVPEEYGGNLEETPVFLGCSDVDPHIPAERVHETARVFERLNADVTTRLYEGMGHGINEDERAFAAKMIDSRRAD